ncbi:hypothetical protein ACGFIE_29865 [Micromonospora sp. NPDC049275]|uniref:hypothetical protein n=1 Tax=Micromonospora sp. NPDC049275 TaxID=3364268 RepID=UPI00371E3F00
MFLTKLGKGDVVWTGASLGLAATNTSHDHVVMGSLSYPGAHSLASIGEYWSNPSSLVPELDASTRGNTKRP